MYKIEYSPEFDFIFYTHIISNMEEMKDKMEKEFKSKAKTLGKDALKRQAAYFADAQKYYQDLSFFQKNTLDMFFHRTDIIFDFLMKLAFKKISIKDMTIEDFKAFLKKLCDCDDVNISSYEEVYPLVKDHYDQPDTIVDFDKTTSLIVDIIKEPKLLEESVKGAILSLYDIFDEKLVQPVRKEIDEAIERHQKVYDQDPHRFIDNLSHGHITVAELHDEVMQPIISYYNPDSMMISLSFNTVIYGKDIELLKKKDESEVYENLIKFLSDGKRYKMVKKLSKKTWYSNELAKEFGITPATMSYHVNKMFKLGLIHFEQGDQNRLYMSLDKERLSGLLDKIKEDLLK